MSVRSTRFGSRRLLFTILMVIILFLASCGSDDEPAELSTDPFAEPARPGASIYDGPVFEMSSDYPQGVAPDLGQTPWQDAIGGGLIDTTNATDFADALKQEVTGDMATLLYDFENWDAAAAGWYSQPWLSSIRDGIHGSYQGSGLSADMFPVSRLSAPMTTHVLVYYDTQAAYSLAGVWGETGEDPVPGLEAGGVQFAEGSIIVKPALTTATPTTWPPVEGAMTWPLWASPDGTQPVQLFEASFFQFDIIVKDTQSSPESQWVFMTLVYDKDAPGSSNWDKMVPLGVAWGNDPTVNSPQACNYLPLESTLPDCPELSETWINPEAPVYAKETLGWGGRLSGPNDGAVDNQASILNSDGSVVEFELAATVTREDGTTVEWDNRYAMSSCMGCHGSAEFETESFLLPAQSVCADDVCSPNTSNGRITYYPSGSAEYLRWFQNRPGTEPQDPGAIALDYGWNYGLKALPLWFKATGQEGQLNHIEAFNDYRGVSPDHLDG